jgi:hypothetical protein
MLGIRAKEVTNPAKDPNSKANSLEWPGSYQARAERDLPQMSARRRSSLRRQLRDAGRYFLPNWLSMPPASISIGARSVVSAR